MLLCATAAMPFTRTEGRQGTGRQKTRGTGYHSPSPHDLAMTAGPAGVGDQASHGTGPLRRLVPMRPVRARGSCARKARRIHGHVDASDPPTATLVEEGAWMAAPCHPTHQGVTYSTASRQHLTELLMRPVFDVQAMRSARSPDVLFVGLLKS